MTLLLKSAILVIKSFSIESIANAESLSWSIVFLRKVLILFKVEKIWSCGTVQTRRLPGLKFTTDKEMQSMGRGTFEEWKANVDGETVTAIKWFDSKPVHLLSTFLSSHPVIEKERFNRKRKENIKVRCPNIVNQYNKAMGRVDLHDQLVSLYRMSFKS